MAIYIGCGRIAEQSELEFFKEMQIKLPPSWLILGNPTLSRNRSTREIDALILSEHTLWTVDIKAWGGKITADANNWQTATGSRKSPIKHVTETLKGYIIDLVNKTLNGQVFAQALVLMMLGKPEDLLLRTDEGERIVYFKDAVDWFLADDKINYQRGKGKIHPLQENLRHKLIKKVAGQRGLHAYLAGGDVVPDKLTTPGANLILTLRQDDFARYYYSNEYRRVCLNKAELRGSDPDLWRNWHGDGVWVDFTSDGIELEALPGVEVRLNEQLIQAGIRTSMDVARGKLNIGGIIFNYTVEKE